jgi:replicative DNA helicase
MSDAPKVPDENDRAQQGNLSSDPSVGTARVPPLRVAGPNDKPGEPCDPAAETALLAALLWAASNAPDVLRASAVADLLEDGEPFYVRAHGDIYEAICSCLAEKMEHDPVAVATQAAKLGRTLSVDALTKLQGVASTVSEKQARVYAKSIRTTWAKRTAIRDLRRIAMDALSPKVSDTEIYEQAQKAALDIMTRAGTTSASVSLEHSAQQFFIRLQKGSSGAMSTGLRDVDLLINDGLRPLETSIVAARTSVGKSTIASQVARHIATSDPKAGVLYVSMEMPHESFAAKILASQAKVGISALRRGALNPSQWSAMTQAVADIIGLPLYFTVNLTQTLASTFAAASERARMLQKDGKRLAMVVIDHIGLVKPSAELMKRGTREQQVAETSRGLRFIATELGCHVMGLAQIHRDAERQGSGTMPKLHQLRESGSLEQDADQIFILHRKRDGATGLFDRSKPAAFSLAKGRMDDTGLVLLGFENGRYVDWNDEDRTFATEFCEER